MGLYVPDRSHPVVVQTRDVLEAIAGFLKAIGTITFGANATTTKILTLYGQIFEFRSSTTPATAGRIRVQIGGDAETTRDTLIDEIDAHLTRINSDIPLVTAEAVSTDAIALTYWAVGTAGNNTITDDDDNITVSGMAGGADGGLGYTSFSGGRKVVAATATPEALVATPTPCRFVWIGAPVTAAGVAVNTLPAFIGESAAKATAAEGAFPLMPNNFEGVIWSIDDASKLYVGVGLNGESVAYRVCG